MTNEERSKARPAAGSVGSLVLFGVPVRFHFTFVLLLVFLLFIGTEDGSRAP